MGRWIWQRAAALPPGSPQGSPLGSPVGAIHTATDGRDVLLNDPDGWEVDNPWLWFTGPAGGDGTGGPYGNPLAPGAIPPGGYLPAVTRSTGLICNTIAGLPWRVMRGYEELTTPDWLADPQALRIDGRVVSPGDLDDVRLSAVEFWSQWIAAALLWGDGYVFVPVRDATTGAPKPPLWQLHPELVSIEEGGYWAGGQRLPPGSVLHLRGEPPYWNGHGTGVLTRHGSELGLACAVRQYAAGVFASGVPAGYLQSTAPNMTQESADALKARWMAQHGNPRRTIAVLNATTAFHPIQISPVDSQLSAAREWSIRDIALAFGLPATMLGVPGDSSTYTNIESRMIEMQQWTLLPWERRIESTLDAQFPRGTSVKIRTEGLLRGDTTSRYDAYTKALAAGWLTVDEVRELEDRPPLAPAEMGVA